MSRPRLAALTRRQAGACGVVLAVAIEAVTVLLRFGADLQSTRDTAWVARLTFGLRVHHGYLGALALAALLVLRDPAWRRGALILGLGLLLSDLAHHFLVLWPWTGSPQFDLVYPPVSR